MNEAKGLFVGTTFHHCFVPFLMEKLVPDRNTSNAIQNSRLEIWYQTYRRRVVSLSKTLYSPKVLVNYPGSGCSVPT